MRPPVRFFAPVRPAGDTPHTAPGAGTFPEPRLLIAEEDAETGGVMLVCYGEGGEFAGDTWHQCFEHAREQADYQLGGRVGPWREIPLGADDPLGYALEVLRTATHEEMG